MFPPHIHDIARKLVDSAIARKKRIFTAESCTGGLVAGAITEIPGASEVLEGGVITYSNGAKTAMLGVPEDLLAIHGAVSAEVVEAMATGVLLHSDADLSVATTGIAGPGGGSALKPVGLVYIGVATREGAVLHYKCMFKGDRDNVRLQSVEEALKLLLSFTED